MSLLSSTSILFVAGIFAAPPSVPHESPPEPLPKKTSAPGRVTEGVPARSVTSPDSMQSKRLTAFDLSVRKAIAAAYKASVIDCKHIANYRDYRASGSASIRIWIDREGNVGDAELVSDSVPSYIAFGDCLVESAKQWELTGIVGLEEKTGSFLEEPAQVQSTPNKNIELPVDPPQDIVDGQAQNQAPETDGNPTDVLVETVDGADPPFDRMAAAESVQSFSLRSSTRPPAVKGWYKGQESEKAKVKPEAGYPRPATKHEIERDYFSRRKNDLKSVPGTSAIGLGLAGMGYGVATLAAVGYFTVNDELNRSESSLGIITGLGVTACGAALFGLGVRAFKRFKAERTEVATVQMTGLGATPNKSGASVGASWEF